MKSTLYLIPNVLGEGAEETILPQVRSIVEPITHFIVEDVRNARRYLRKIGYKKDFDTEVTFYELNKHTDEATIHRYLAPLLQDEDVALLSEAGCPAVADPGAEVVKRCQEKNITVKPLVGPSSILLAIMASGFSGQYFTFNGYLPIQNPERKKRIQHLEKMAHLHTQIFIETPFRNNSLLVDILEVCGAETLLSVAMDLTLPTEYVKTKTIKAWRQEKIDLHKKPVVFSLYRG